MGKGTILIIVKGENIEVYIDTNFAGNWDPKEYTDRGSIPAKVGFWVGLRIFLYVPTPTKLTNAISKTQLSGPKKGVFLPKIPRMWPFFVFGVF